MAWAEGLAIGRGLIDPYTQNMMRRRAELEQLQEEARRMAELEKNNEYGRFMGGSGYLDAMLADDDGGGRGGGDNGERGGVSSLTSTLYPSKDSLETIRKAGSMGQGAFAGATATMIQQQANDAASRATATARQIEARRAAMSKLRNARGRTFRDQFNQAGYAPAIDRPMQDYQPQETPEYRAPDFSALGPAAQSDAQAAARQKDAEISARRSMAGAQYARAGASQMGNFLRAQTIAPTPGGGPAIDAATQSLAKQLNLPRENPRVQPPLLAPEPDPRVPLDVSTPAQGRAKDIQGAKAETTAGRYFNAQLLAIHKQVASIKNMNISEKDQDALLDGLQARYESLKQQAAEQGIDLE